MSDNQVMSAIGLSFSSSKLNFDQPRLVSNVRFIDLTLVLNQFLWELSVKRYTTSKLLEAQDSMHFSQQNYSRNKS